MTSSTTATATVIEGFTVHYEPQHCDICGYEKQTPIVAILLPKNLEKERRKLKKLKKAVQNNIPLKKGMTTINPYNYVNICRMCIIELLNMINDNNYVKPSSS